MADAASEASSSLSPLLTLVGWWFLPSVLSKILLRVVYTVLPKLEPRPPPLPARPPGLPANAPIPVDAQTHIAFQKANATAQRNQRRAQIFVIGSYLVYGVVSLYLSQQGGNFYARLGLHSDALGSSVSDLDDFAQSTDIAGRGARGSFLDDAGLKTHWRRLARVAHPDKYVERNGIPPAMASQERLFFEKRFIKMREAYETLSDETKRWGYERYGPEVTTWKDCASKREFVKKGATRMGGLYLVSGVTLYLIGVFRVNDTGTFWRWYILLASMVAEAIIVLFPPSHRLAFLIRFVFPNRTPFEHVLLVRQLALAGSCAITQIGSILASGEDTKKLPTEKEYAEVMSVLATQAERNLEVAKAIEAELAGIMASEVRAVVEGHKLAKGDPTKPVPKEEIDELRGRMSAAMVEIARGHELRSTPEGREAWQAAVERLAKNGPSSARDTTGVKAESEAEDENEDEIDEAVDGNVEVKKEPVDADLRPVDEQANHVKSPAHSASNNGIESSSAPEADDASNA